MTITNPQEKFVHELCLTYDAEHQFLEAQQEMLQQASDGELQGMTQTHIDETQQQIQNLEQVFDQMGQQPQRVTSQAAQGLVADGQTAMQEAQADEIRDTWSPRRRPRSSTSRLQGPSHRRVADGPGSGREPAQREPSAGAEHGPDDRAEHPAVHPEGNASRVDEAHVRRKDRGGRELSAAPVDICDDLDLARRSATFGGDPVGARRALHLRKLSRPIA